jgi:hypothetical protein
MVNRVLLRRLFLPRHPAQDEAADVIGEVFDVLLADIDHVAAGGKKGTNWFFLCRSRKIVYNEGT